MSPHSESFNKEIKPASFKTIGVSPWKGAYELYEPQRGESYFRPVGAVMVLYIFYQGLTPMVLKLANERIKVGMQKLEENCD